MNTDAAKTLDEQEAPVSSSDMKFDESDLLPVPSSPSEALKMTQAEADEVMDSAALLQALRETEASNDVDDPSIFTQKWLIASLFIFLIYLALVFYVK